ncbi:aldehyde dehydrogenase family protein [Amycolatopsis alkalitolerans]|uniref:Aldehyde dehydrogenase family protein n=1 Tax=Amycolatopsis alkalitolerans TaxID=2547244 RepID=A0A5C4M132_9PSEU|nr:aldehyde dehydrogenase family protein [Amycolatopsis alkalitolerans]TNC23430.1 aldehyde dehydrogenase family protein [Amycolatopsis alkalitolerans]
MKGNFIGGEWGGSGAWFERVNPADPREIVSRAPQSTSDEVATAVGAVAAGYPEWSDKGPEFRARVLEKAAAVLESDPDGLARELVREEGKTLAEARNEVNRTPQNLRFYAGEALRLAGETYPTGDGSLVYTSREPVGVVAAITPWNFPLNLPSRKLGPALAAGNGVVFKPSEVTPLMGQRMVEALLEAGLPAGAIALVHGDGSVGAALVADERVGAVTFTGSTAVGEKIHASVGASRRCQLEMGGKNPVVVLEDADLDRACDIIVRGAFSLSGQACTGTSRVIVHDAVHDALLDRVLTRVKDWRIGNGLTDGVRMGPLATEAQWRKTRQYLEIGEADGAKLRTGQEPLPDSEFGFFARPAVFTGVDRESRLAREEVFGPVLGFLRAGSFEEAVEVANDTDYGLSAGIVTRDIARALAFSRQVHSGLIKVNQPTSGMAGNAPFGGVKRSSTQTFKEQAGETMMRFYTVDKTVYLTP